MLLDLDGFKGYNDSFGHPAGDALLARLAKKLAAAVSGQGDVYRIGGDEFCVLGGVVPAGKEAFAAAAAQALQEHGEGFRITAAKGRSRSLGGGGASPRRSGSWTGGCTTRRMAGARRQAARAATSCSALSTSATPGCRDTSADSSSSCARSAPALGLSEDELGDVDARRRAARGGQARDPGLDPPQARAADRGGGALRPPPPADRRADPVVRAGARQGVAARPLDPRAHGRRRDTPTARGGGHSAPVAHHRRVRGVRRDDVRAAVQPGTHARGGLVELRRCAGTQFDADVVETLVIVRAEHSLDLASVA